MHMRPIANVVLPILVRAYERSEQTQEIKYNSVTRAGAYVRSGPPCDSHCEPQCLRLWHREVYCEACGVTSREAFRAGAGGGLLGQLSYLCTSSDAHDNAWPRHDRNMNHKAHAAGANASGKT